jgi:transcriptional regulator with XRE-family HTH domain
MKSKSKAKPEVKGQFWNVDGCKQFRRKKRELGMSYQQLADFIECKRHALWKWWHGLARPAVRKRQVISDRLGIPHEAWLLAEEKKTLRASLAMLDKQKTATKAIAAQRRRVLDALGKT